jgi:hypothetical protein
MDGVQGWMLASLATADKISNAAVTAIVCMFDMKMQRAFGCSLNKMDCQSGC